MPPSTSPDYGPRHRRLREWWGVRVSMGVVRCARCRELIGATESWDLDHRDGCPTDYLGPSHSRCNRATDPRYREKRRPEAHPGAL